MTWVFLVLKHFYTKCMLFSINKLISVFFIQKRNKIFSVNKTKLKICVFYNKASYVETIFQGKPEIQTFVSGNIKKCYQLE